MTSLTEKRIVNISLTEAPISTGPRNLESARKITSGRNLRSTIQTKGWNTGIRQENRTTKENRRVQPKKGQKEHYNNGDDNIR
jgi:hypothetical protein